MAAKKPDSTSALVTVVKAIEPLSDADKRWVLNSAASRWTLNIQAQVGAASGVSGPGEAVSQSQNSIAPDLHAAIAGKDVRAFIRAKKPLTDVQRIACLGAYLAQTTGQHGFTSKDIATAHTDSGGSKINLPRAMDNATRKSKYISNRSRSEKQLTPLGEDVVDALPDQDAVKALDREARGRGSKAKRGKKGRKA